MKLKQMAFLIYSMCLSSIDTLASTPNYKDVRSVQFPDTDTLNERLSRDEEELLNARTIIPTKIFHDEYLSNNFTWNSF